jgi:hypothetical protein
VAVYVVEHSNASLAASALAVNARQVKVMMVEVVEECPTIVVNLVLSIASELQ